MVIDKSISDGLYRLKRGLQYTGSYLWQASNRNGKNYAFQYSIERMLVPYNVYADRKSDSLYSALLSKYYKIANKSSSYHHCYNSLRRLNEMLVV